MAEWHYVKNDRQCGPVSQETLMQMAAAGQIAADDLVWTDAMKDWAPAGEVPGLIAPATAALARSAAKKRSSGGWWGSLSDGTKVGIMVMAGGGLLVLLMAIGLVLMSNEPPKPKPKPAVAKTKPTTEESEEPKLRVIAFDPKSLETEEDKKIFEKGRKQGEHITDRLAQQLGENASPQQKQKAVDEEMESRHVAVQAAVTDGGPKCEQALLAFGRREGFKSSIKRLHLPTPANME